MQTAKQHPIFGKTPLRTRRNTWFVLMPFRKKWSDRTWEVIKSVLAQRGITAVRADEVKGSIIIEDIWREINSAERIIADVTTRNANVFYEIGIAHAIGKDVLLLTQSTRDIPFDLNRFRHIIYEASKKGDWAFRTKILEVIQKGRQSPLSEAFYQKVLDSLKTMSAKEGYDFLRQNVSTWEKMRDFETNIRLIKWSLRARRVASGLSRAQGFHLQIDLARNYRGSQKFRKASITLNKILRDQASRRDEEVGVKARVELGLTYMDDGNWGKARRNLQQSLSRCRGKELTFEKGRCHKGLALIFYELNDHAKSLEAARASVRVFKRLRERRELSETLWYLALGYEYDWREQFRKLKKALAYAQQNGVQDIEGWVRQTLSENLIDRKATAAEIEAHANEAMKIFKRIKSQDGQAWTSATLGNLYLNQGRMRKAFRWFQSGIVLCKSIKEQGILPDLYTGLARCYLIKAKPSKSLRYANLARRCCEPRDVQSLSPALVARAKALIALNRPALEITECFRRGEKVAVGDGFRKFRAETYSAWADWEAGRGHAQKGLVLYRKAEESFDLANYGKPLMEVRVKIRRLQSLVKRDPALFCLSR